MIRACDILAFTAYAVYWVAGIALYQRMRAEKRIDPPIGSGRYDEQAYSPEGQRLLRIYRWWILPRPILVVFGVIIVRVVLCQVAAWL